MRSIIRNPYHSRKLHNVQDNTLTQSTTNSDFITFERSEHIKNQHVGAQYAKQSLEVAETIEANEHRNEFFMTLEIKCDRRIATETGLCQYIIDELHKADKTLLIHAWLNPVVEATPINHKRSLNNYTIGNVRLKMYFGFILKLERSMRVRMKVQSIHTYAELRILLMPWLSANNHWIAASNITAMKISNISYLLGSSKVVNIEKLRIALEQGIQKEIAVEVHLDL